MRGDSSLNEALKTTEPKGRVVKKTLPSETMSVRNERLTCLLLFCTRGIQHSRSLAPYNMGSKVNLKPTTMETLIGPCPEPCPEPGLDESETD